jgi:hypothetical protein
MRKVGLRRIRAQRLWPVTESDFSHEPVETKRYTMAELYELRRIIIKHSRSRSPGPDRNEHRQIASSMCSLFKDEAWLAVHTISDGKNAVSHEIRNGR